MTKTTSKISGHLKKYRMLDEEAAFQEFAYRKNLEEFLYKKCFRITFKKSQNYLK